MSHAKFNTPTEVDGEQTNLILSCLVLFCETGKTELKTKCTNTIYVGDVIRVIEVVVIAQCEHV
jgi:hypothetical protein